MIVYTAIVHVITDIFVYIFSAKCKVISFKTRVLILRISDNCLSKCITIIRFETLLLR